MTRFMTRPSSLGSGGMRVANGWPAYAAHDTPRRASCRLGDRGFLQHEIVVHDVERALERLAGRRLAGRHFLEIDDQRFLHPVHHVVVEVAVAALEQMGDDAVIARRLDREMDVRRPEMADV